MKAGGFGTTQVDSSGPGNGDFSVSLSDWQAHLLDRRRFLTAAAGGTLALLFSGAANAASADDAAKTTGPAESTPADALSEAQRWAIIEAVQQHLFPSEDAAPGASELNALLFLQRAMAEPDRDPEEAAFVLQGAGWLQQLAQPQGGFAGLDESQREQLLRRIAASQAGENWLSTLLLFILQALLVDPIYGGNPDGIGWAWLRHTPGFPQPTEPYYQLPFFRL